MRTFGPIPSRRLGNSLGINNIPAKVCSFNCVYCQLGRTAKLSTARHSYYDPEEILRDVRTAVECVRRKKESIDYLTFVPDGEPTLDINLGREIDLLRSLGIPVAVFTNSSLIWKEDVREDLAKADLVSVKIDAFDQKTWHRIDRPHPDIQLESVLSGIRDFAKNYRGVLATETMVLKGINDNYETISALREILLEVKPRTAYLLTPTRPPAEKSVQSAEGSFLTLAKRYLGRGGCSVETVTGPGGMNYTCTADMESSLLDIAAVHPIPERAARQMLEGTDEGWALVEKLVLRGALQTIDYNGERYFVRRPLRTSKT